MPAFLVPLIVKFALPMVLAELQRLGLINEAEAVATKFGLSVLKTIDNIKVYSRPDDYPSGRDKPSGV